MAVAASIQEASFNDLEVHHRVGVWMLASDETILPPDIAHGSEKLNLSSNVVEVFWARTAGTASDA
jgi:hypothetical protein